jgi:hypothetical protein
MKRNIIQIVALVVLLACGWFAGGWAGVGIAFAVFLVVMVGTTVYLMRQHYVMKEPAEDDAGTPPTADDAAVPAAGSTRRAPQDHRRKRRS